jgi:hypothetical protein
LASNCRSFTWLNTASCREVDYLDTGVASPIRRPSRADQWPLRANPGGFVDSAERRRQV